MRRVLMAAVARLAMVTQSAGACITPIFGALLLGTSCSTSTAPRPAGLSSTDDLSVPAPVSGVPWRPPRRSNDCQTILMAIRRLTIMAVTCRFWWS